MVTKFLNVSTDPTLSANSNILVPSEKAVRAFIASKAIQLDFLQSTTPTTFSTGQKWLNTSTNLLYTATSSSAWDSGVSAATDQFFTYLDLLYYFDGTTINSYSSLSITEINQNRQVRRWLGTRAEYNALTTKDPSVMYEVIEDSVDYALLASQEQFNNGENTVAATPYQVLQELGNYLSLINGGNLAAGKTIGLTNTNNEVSTLGYNTSGYITVSNKLYVTGETSVNSLVARGGNIYKGSTSGSTVLWSDSTIPATALPTATTTTLGGVKVDGSTIIISNGVISASGTTVAYDSTLSTTSTNAVQNAIVTAAINGKVSKSGDTMTGNLTIQKSAPAILLTNSSNNNTFNIRANDVNANLDIMTNTGIGIYLNSNNGYQPYYSDGSNAYRLLNTNDILSVSTPVGSLAFGPVTAMNGYLLCNGQAVSRTTYSSLFAAIGTNFGAGDGSTTFNVPDYRGCFLRGLGGESASNMYTKQAMGAPNITGTFSVVRKGGAENPAPTGAFTQTTWDAHNGSGGSDDYGGTYTLDASRSSSAYGAANEIRPVNFAVNIFIKY